MAEQVQASHQDLERRVSEMTRDLATLYAITSPISGTNELKSVLADALAMIMQVTGADAGTIRLIDPQTNQFVVSSYVGLSEIYVREAPLATGDDEMLAEVLRSGQPAIAGDLVEDPRTRHSPLLWDGLRSAVYLPLKTPKSNLGAVVLASREPGGFSLSQRELFGVVSRQISTTIENARLFEEAERRRVEAEEFARIVGMLTESLDVSGVGQRVAESVLKLLSVDSAVLWLLQPDGSMIATASAGAARERYAAGKSVMPRGTGMPGRAVREGAPVWSGDVLRDHVPYSEEIRNIFVTQGSVAALAVPFRMQGKIIGALVASDRVGREFADREVSLLQTFASQAGLAFEQARLHEETDRRRREAEELAEVARTLTESLDVKAVADRIIEGVQRLLDVAESTVYQLQDEQSLLALAVSDNSGLRNAGLILPVGTGVAGQAVVRGEPVFSTDVLHDPEIVLTELHQRLAPLGDRSVLAVPLRSKGQIIGALSVSDRVGRRFTEVEVALLQTFGDQAALALENARLFKETERRLQETAALLDIAGVFGSTLELKHLLKEIALRTAQAVGMERCSIFLWNEGRVEPVMSQFADGHAVPELWRAFKGMERYRVEEIPGFAEAIRLRQPVVVEDAATTDLGPRGWAEIFSTQTILVVPLIRRDNVVGVLQLDNTTGPRSLRPDQIALAGTIASQVALAVDNARLYEETERRRREAEALARVAQSLTESLDMTAVGEQIVTSVRELFGVKAAMLRLLQPDGSLCTLASRGESFSQQSGGDTLPPGSGLTGLAVAEGRPIWSADVLNEPKVPLTDEMRDHQLRSGNRSMIVVPLHAHEKIIGSLGLQDRTGRTYTDGEVELLRTFADQAALALENARLFEETRRRNLELQALYTVTNATTQSLDIKSLTQAALATTIQVLGVDAGRLYVLDETDRVLRLTSHQGLPVDELTEYESYAPDEGVVGQIFSQNRPVVFADLSSDQGYTAMARAGKGKAWGFRSAAGLPITAKGQPVGVIYVYGRTVREFTPQDLKFLSVIGEQIGGALENARLYEEAERRRGEAEALAQVARSLTESLEVEAVATRIVEGVQRLLHVEDATVYQLQDEGSLLALAVSGGSGLRKAGDILSVGTGAAGQAVVKGEPVFSSDILHDPKIVLGELHQQLEPLGDRSVLAIPLRSKGQIIGALSVSGRVGRVFRDAEISLLQTFGDQAALTLEKARLYQETERRRRETEELAQVARSLTESLELEAVATRIVEGVRRLLKVPESTVFRLQADGSLVAVALSGVLKDDGRKVGYVLSPGAGVSGRAVATGEPAYCADILKDAELTKTDVHQHLTSSGIRSVVSTPIRSKGQVIGALAAGDQVGRVFTENDVALLQTFGDQAALALENARLYEAERTRQEQLSAVRKVGQEVSTELELEPLLHLIVRRAVELAGVSSGIVYTLEDEVLLPRAWWNLGPWLSQIRFPLGQGIPGIVAQSGQAMIVNDYLHSPYVNALFRDRSTVTALVAMPLISKGKVVGVITINNSETDRRFTEADQAILSLFAPQAAAAIENARLFEETERRRREAEELGRVSRTLTESLDVSAVGERIVQSVLPLFAAQDAAAQDAVVWLVQPDSSMAVLASTSRAGDVLARGYAFPPGVGLPARVIADGRPVWFSDVLSQEDILLPDDLRRRLADSGTAAVLGVPLRAKGKTLGALIIRGQTGRAFSKDEVALLEMFATQAALALENARLFGETERLVGELGATTKELAGRNKELDTFVYTVSHDLKAPLVTLQGMADLLAESCGKDLDEQGQHYVTRIRANAQQMERLVLDLLTLSRIGREGRAPEAVVLDELVDELLLEWGERIRTRGVTLTRHKLPTLWGVRTQIEQVIGNLVGNAIKYMGDTPAPVVEIGANDSGGDMAECYVKDNGIGIDPAYHEKVFEIFQRLQETEAEGTGVGLAIVKKVVEGAGGQIRLESARGQGATFRFTWPRAEVAA